MSRTLILACLSFTLTSAVTAQTHSPAHPVQRVLSFVANKGQAPADVLWEARGNGFTVSFSRESFVLGVFPAKPDSKIVEQKISLAESNPAARIEPLDPLPGKFSFFAGSDPSRWVRGLSTYSRLRYANIYPGIDLLFYGNHGKLEYDFVVSPGADPGQIRLRVDGTAHITERGELQLGEDSQITLHRPVLYQNTDGGKKIIEGRFISRGDGQAGFQSGRYDRSKPLVIDPTVNLLYATYLGGLHNDQAYAVALDSRNNSYILGESASTDYPVSANAYQTERTDIGAYSYNIVVTEFSPGGILLYSTFLGLGTGVSSGIEHPSAITVDQLGNTWITGTINSNSAGGLPVTANAYQSTFSMGAQANMFFSEISPDGSSLLYSSYFAGPGGVTLSPPNTPSLVSAKIAVDQNEHVFLAGEAGSGLPTTAGAYLASIPSGQYAPFVAAFDTTQAPAQQLLAASYLDPASSVLPGPNYVGQNPSSFTELVLDSSGNPWMLGSTFASNFPTTNGAIQPSITLAPCNAPGDPLDRAAFVAKLSADLKTLLYGSYLSGKVSGANPSSYCVEFPTSATLDARGNLYVAGVTTSDKFPTTAGVFDQTATVKEVGYWQFLAKISSDGSTIDWATYFGQGGGDGSGPFVGVDGQLNVWVADSDPLTPTTSNALQRTPNPSMIDEAVAELSSDGTTVLYATFLPQVATQYPYPADTVRAFKVDKQGNTYFTGWTGAGVIPVTPNAFQSQFADADLNPDGNDAFFMMFGSGAISGIGPTTGGNTGDTTVTINGGGFEPGATCSLIDGGTSIHAASVVVNSTGTSVTCTFALNGAIPGTYDVAVANPDGSGSTDKGAFTVAAAGQPNVWTMLTGRSQIRLGVPSPVSLNYGNSGSENAYLTTIWVVLPSAYSFTISGLTNPTDINCPALGTLPIFFAQNGMSYIPLLVPVIPAGSTSSIVINVTAPVATPQVELDGYAEEPWFSSLSAANQFLSGASATPASVPNTCVAGTGIAVCLGLVSTEAQPPVAGYLSQLGITDLSIANDTTAQLATGLNSILASAKANAVLPWELVFDEVGADIATRRFGITGQCAAPFSPPNIDPEPDPDPLPDPCPGGVGYGNHLSSGSTSPCMPQTPGAAHDPNDKAGPNGDGSASRFIRPVSPLVYTIAFENQASATLPAAQVVVSDVLDPTKLDLTTLSLANIAFGTNVITVPANTNNYSTLFPINSSLSVRIQGSLNPDTNTLKWTFTSIDPSAGLPPSDPTVGFLPPDTNGVEGEGSVTFSIMPKSGQATGTEITNQATVVFDANAPINTLTWLNTLDVDPPVSAVAALPAVENSACFTVSWSGTDVGSGISTYTIFVSDNGSPFAVWLASSMLTSSTYTGQAGHSYAFYSVAQDAAGNLEQKAVADTNTSVAANATSCAPGPAVPNVVGLTQAAATTAITGAGLVVGTVTPASNSTVPSGSVISESPVAGTQVNTGSAVNLVVSSGPAQVAVPNVVGLTQAAATTAITGVGLVLGTVTTASSSTVPSGNVISESPVAGTQVNTGLAVNLVISSGPAQVAVPNVVGLTQAAATTAIAGAGLVVGTLTTASSSTVPSGSVISESPVAGTQVNTGSAVNLVISSGPAQVAVPNVVGLTQAAATTAITGAGLVVGTLTTASSSTVPSGNVISESPVAATKVNVGSAVNLVISSGPAQVAVPNVVALTQAAATTAIAGADLVVGTVTTAPSSTVPSGSVISESPVAGTQVNTGSAVNLVVSSGPAQVAVPNVVALTQAAATTAIAGAGLVVGTVTTASSSTVPSGSVISESPVAATKVNVGSAVNLLISSGTGLTPQTIKFNAISSQVQGKPLTLSASASSGLAVTFRSSTPTICAVSGTTATLVSAGTCTIVASQPGTAVYAPAPPVSQSFTVHAAYTITPIPTEMVSVGDIATFALELRSTTGFNGSITLSCSGGPAGTSCRDFPTIVRLFDGYGLAISGIQVPKSTPQGTYTITFKGVSGGITNTATATFKVKSR